MAERRARIVDPHGTSGDAEHALSGRGPARQGTIEKMKPVKTVDLAMPTHAMPARERRMSGFRDSASADLTSTRADRTSSKSD